MLLNNIIWFWNLLHYFIYLFNVKIYKVIDYVNPITWLLKISIIQNFFKRKGINDINKLIDRNINSKQFSSTCVTWAGIHMGGLMVIVEFSFFNLLQVCLGQSLIQHVWNALLYKVLFLIALLIPQGLINYFILFRNNKYMYYFEKFDKLPLSTKKLYGLICIFSISGIFLVFIGSFFLYSHILF